MSSVAFMVLREGPPRGPLSVSPSRPLTSPVLGHLTIPRNYLRTAPDSCGLKIAQKLGRPLVLLLVEARRWGEVIRANNIMAE